MRIVLLYPPPWKIPAPDESPDYSGEGPPAAWNEAYQLSGDIVHIPCGLLSIAAQAKQAGHNVTVLNLYIFAWRDVCRIIQAFPADLFGLSCFTSNRRGTLSTAHEIRRMYPHAHITAGGPHASALSREMLEHCPAIDTIVIGEGEETVKEIIYHLENKKPVRSIAGTAWRTARGVSVAPSRTQIEDLDTLAPACAFFSDYIVLSSRGCAENCTFCASPFLWKRITRFHSTEYVLEMLEQLVTRHGLRALAFKDDTFTANRDRVLEICHGIRQRKLNFLWSCDTRVDALDEELLCAMRQAGCQRISFGIESAAPKILRSLNKKTTLDEIRTATSMAKKFGFQIRYYLIAGSRGDTAETLSMSIDLIKEALPSQYVFNPFTLIPGTKEFEIAERSGLAQSSMFFTNDFFELTPNSDENLGVLIAEFKMHPGVQDMWDYSTVECRSIIQLFPALHAAHMDLAGALYREGNFEEAEESLQQALDLDYPLPGLCYNYRACIAAARGDTRGALENLIRARECGFHQVVESNLQAVQAWVKAEGHMRSRLPALTAHHRFEITSRKLQPITPAPITLHDSDAPMGNQSLVISPVNSQCVSW